MACIFFSSKFNSLASPGLAELASIPRRPSAHSDPSSAKRDSRSLVITSVNDLRYSARQSGLADDDDANDCEKAKYNAVDKCDIAQRYLFFRCCDFYWQHECIFSPFFKLTTIPHNLPRPKLFAAALLKKRWYREASSSPSARLL